MYNNYEDWEEAMCQADKPEQWQDLEDRLDDVKYSVKALLRIFYSREPINESDLEQALGNLADSVDLCLPEGTVQIARKSQALMDLQRYLLTMNEK